MCDDKLNEHYDIVIDDMITDEWMPQMFHSYDDHSEKDFVGFSLDVV